ncbi:Scr1 family TA system antitoxin-like transcriptional regulator [Streptomyces sp. NPDC059142]|uniref:Scr1 family TA system antitoxin-like transcriptional regulator n=1 Tax=Streptomyces sp. NPDC059142 TaxID=3346739 RepID=UPI0036C95D3C
MLELTTSSGLYWWDRYRGRLSPGLLDIAEPEWHAVAIRTTQTAHVPGLLRTEEYARSVFAAVLPALSRLEVELRVAHRVGYVWEEPFCGEGNNCFRIGADADGRAYMAVAGREDTYPL